MSFRQNCYLGSNATGTLITNANNVTFAQSAP